MKALLNAFTDLPTWQGIALIAVVVAFVAALCLWINWLAYNRGRRDADANHLHFATKRRDLESIS
jgi:hypothetical protein